MKKFFVKILIYNKDGWPTTEIQGMALDGNINLDGNSSVRRSCSLNIIGEQELTHAELLQFMFMEFELLLSTDNITYTNYGRFLISSLGCDKSEYGGYKISIEGKDKMCRLNGDLGGNFTNLSTNLSVQNIIDTTTGASTEQEVDLHTLITELVHAYGGEPREKIFIYDLPQVGYEMLTYNGQEPLYIYNNNQMYEHTTSNSNEYVAVKQINDTYQLLRLRDEGINFCSFDNLLDTESIASKVLRTQNGIETTEVLNVGYEIDNEKYTITYPLTYQFSKYRDATISFNETGAFWNDITIEGIPGKQQCKLTCGSPATFITYCDYKLGTNVEITYMADAYYDTEDTEYTIIKLEKGAFAGYHETDLVYTGNLTASLGDTITSILDKIKTMLGVYEYFYDHNGNFIFQKKQYTESITESSLKNQAQLIQDPVLSTSVGISEVFKDLELISSARYSYNVTNIKNDYSIWGERDGVPIHLRMAIAKKPTYYKTYAGQEYATEVSEYINSLNNNIYDWREILYQMALDSTNNSKFPDFKQKISSYNSGKFVRLDGTTGYEVYYPDILGFWRDVYDPDPEPIYTKIVVSNEAQDKVYVNNYKLTTASALTEAEKMNKTNIYTLSSDKKELLRYIDTLDLCSIVGSLDQLYYYKNNKYHRIIDSVNLTAQNVYVKTLDKTTEDEDEEREILVHFYDSFTDALKQKLYYTTYAGSQNYKKLLTYTPIQNYLAINKQTNRISNKLFVTNTDSTEKTEVYEFWLHLQNGDMVCLWQKDNINTTLSDADIAILAECAKTYALGISYRAKNRDLVRYNYGQNFVLEVEALMSNTDIVYYLDDEDNSYHEILNYLISNAEDDSMYNIYNLYIYNTELGRAVKIDELINLNKAELYSKEYLGVNPIYIPITDKISLPVGNFYYKTQDKITVQDLQDDLQPLYYNSNSGQYELQLYRSLLNIYGNKSVLNQQQKYNIEYYDKSYNYLLGNNGNYLNCWNKQIYNNFNTSHFWLDFIYENHPIVQFSIHDIGVRSKTLNQKSATHLTNECRLDAIYTHDISKRNQKDYLYMDNNIFLNNFIINHSGCSCHDLVNDCLASFNNLINSISFSIIPKYLLQPGDIIQLSAIDNKLMQGYYEINRITFALGGTGTMSLEASKIQNI